ncbi:MAG: efflux RND transporter periplasmic adaptor subunit [Bacteroidetes bacterium]|nr:efflux RND transporter periplasmic adaptor subunit [Bacteroidota bacterium]
MKNTFLFLLLLGMFWSCGDSNHSHEDGADHNHDHTYTPPQAVDGLAMLSPEQVKLANISYTSFTKKNISETLSVNAELVVHTEHTADVTAFSDGILSSLRTTLNASVRKGQILATVRKPDLLDMQQQFLENKDQLQFLQAEFDRYKSLKDADATASKNFLKAEADLRAAKTTGQLLAAKLRQYQINPDKLTAANLSTELVLTSPVNGLVTSIETNVGAAVQPGTIVCEVTDLSQLHADLWVFEKDISKVKTGQRVQLAFPANPSKTYPAVIYSMDKVLDPDKRAVRAHARLEGSVAGQANFVDGGYLEAKIATSGLGEGNALPEAAVVQEGEEYFIFTLEKESAEGSFFKKIKVEKGGEADGYVAVSPKDALPEGAKIVLKGAYYVSAQGAGVAAEE